MRFAGRLAGAGALLAVAVLAGGCGGAPTPLSKQVQDWANNAGYSSDVAQIRSDLTNLSNGLREHKLPQLRTECEGFSVDVETLYGELPTPDHTITDELGTSLMDMYNAGRDCYDAKSFTSTSFATYQHQLASGLDIYHQALRRLAADHVS